MQCYLTIEANDQTPGRMDRIVCRRAFSDALQQQAVRLWKPTKQTGLWFKQPHNAGALRVCSSKHLKRKKRSTRAMRMMRREDEAPGSNASDVL